jgi:hypothetical protein
MQASIIEVPLSLIRTGLVDVLLPLVILSGVMQAKNLSNLWSLD